MNANTIMFALSLLAGALAIAMLVDMAWDLAKHFWLGRNPHRGWQPRRYPKKGDRR